MRKKKMIKSKETKGKQIKKSTWWKPSDNSIGNEAEVKSEAEEEEEMAVLEEGEIIIMDFRRDSRTAIEMALMEITMETEMEIPIEGPISHVICVDNSDMELGCVQCYQPPEPV